jgi:hypothetical protein
LLNAGISDSAIPVMQEKKFGRFGILLKDIVKNTHKALQAFRPSSAPIISYSDCLFEVGEVMTFVFPNFRQATLFEQI